MVIDIVNQNDNIILAVIKAGVDSTVGDHHSRLVLRIVEEVQIVAAIGHVRDVLVLQGVVGYLADDITRGVIIIHAGLLGAQTVFVVFKGDLIMALLA